MRACGATKFAVLGALWLALGTVTAVYADGIPGQGTWQTTLQPRDLDGDGVVDAFYDTVLNITWLRNADVNGIQFRDDAAAWARSLRLGGYSDWRLPTMVDTGRPGCDWAYGGTDCGYNVQTKSLTRVYSEMEHLLRLTLGNTPYCDTGGTCKKPNWGLANTGDFQNLQPYFYWLGADYPGSGAFGWYYYTPTIYQSFGVKILGMYAMAVRPGDSTSGQPGVSNPIATGTASEVVDKPFSAAQRVAGQGTWQTTLQPRDLDGDGVADAFFDTELNVTWLRDLGKGGLQFWDDANAWVRTLDIGGYSDWRLPTMVDTQRPGCNPGFSGTDCGFNVQTITQRRTYSELAHLLHETLGNKGYCNTSAVCDQPGWRTLNTGDFQNMSSVFIWTAVEYSPDPRLGWYYYPYTGYQSFGYKAHMLQVLPVRTGDSGVPVP